MFVPHAQATQRGYVLLSLGTPRNDKLACESTAQNCLPAAKQQLQNGVARKGRPTTAPTSRRWCWCFITSMTPAARVILVRSAFGPIVFGHYLGDGCRRRHHFPLLF